MTRIENSLKVVVSTALAMVLTLAVMTGISGARGQEMARQAALNSQAMAASAVGAG